MSVIPNRRGKQSFLPQPTSTSRNKRTRRQFSLEKLEERVVLSYTFNLVAGIATAVQDPGSNGDELIIQDVGGFLEHAVVNSANPTPIFSGSWGGFSVADTPTQVVVITQAAGAASVPGFPEGVTFGTTTYPADLLKSQNISVSGAVSDSAVTIDDSTGTIQATGINQYSYNGTTFNGPGAFSIAVGNVQNDGLTVLGSSLNDTFFAPGNFPGEPVNFVGGSGTNTVNVGTGGVVSGTNSPLRVTDPTGTATVNVNDQSDTTHPTATFDNLSGNLATPFELTGLSPGAIEYGTGVTALIVNGGVNGGAGVTYDINNTQAGTTTTINGGANKNFINLSNPAELFGLDNVAGPVVVHGGTSLADVVTLDDSSANFNDNYTITSTTVSRVVFGGLTYDGNIGTLTLNAENTLGTNGNNTININSTAAFVVTNVNGQGGHDTINVNNTGALGSLNVSTGSGGSTVNVVADNEPVHIANNGLDTDNIGSTGGPGTLAGIQAPITITDLPSFISLNFHDELDATGQTWTLDTDNVADTASVAVTGSALVSYRPGDLSELTVNGGIGGNTFNVNDTANGVPTTINAGLTGTNTVNAFATGTGSTLNIDAQGSSSNAVNLGGLVAVGLQHFVDGATVVNVTDTTGLEAVTLDDSQDATSQTATLTDNGTTATVTGLAPATIKVADLGLSSLTIFGGSGGNTFTVDGTPANAPTTINSGTGDDTVNVWATTGPALLTINGQNGADTVNIGFFGSLAGILGPIAVTNAFDFTALNIDASADTNPHDINLIADPSDTTSTFTGLAPATITYTIGDISQIGLTLGNAGAGSNNLSVDFSNGNPIQFENNPGLIYDAGSGAANTLNLRGQLPAAFGGPGFASEVHDANGAGFGAISFTDHNSNASGLTYTGLAVDPINDTANATNYTFNDNAFPDATFAAVVGPVILGFNTIQFNSDTSTPPAQFTTTNISNKTNVVFNSNNTLIGQTGVVNIPTAWTVGPNPLTNLTFNTLNAANNLVSFIATPPNVVTSLNGGTATDVTNVTGTGVAPGTTLKLDGGAFIDTLNYNAGGLIPTVSAGALPGEIIITLPGFGSVDAVNYEQINITNVGPLTVTPTANPLNSVEGFNYVNAPVGSFTTTIPTIFPTTPAGLPASSFTSTVDWGDPSPDNTGGTITQDATNSNNYFVAGSHTYTTPGAFTDTLSVAFSGGPVTETVNGVPVSVIFPATAAATSSNTATVTQGVLAVTAFPIVGTEGAAIAAAPIATFIDAGGADAVANYTATINIVNSAGTTVLSVPAASIVQIGNSAEYTVNAPALTLPDEGTYQLQVTVTDSELAGPITVTGAAQVVIADAKLTGVAVPALTPNTGVKLPPTTVVGKFTDANTAAPAGDFTAVIDWGDGSPTSLGTIVSTGGGGFSVEGAHQYAKPGTFATTIVVTDVGGSTVTLTGTATVTDAAVVAGPALTIHGVEGSSTGSVVLATFTDPNPLATASDVEAVLTAWGDGTPASAVPVAVNLIGSGPAGAVFSITGSHNYAEEGSFTIAITVTTSGGVTTPIAATAVVADAPLNSTGAAITGVEGITTNPQVIATFTDSDPNGTIADYTSGGGSVVVNWGDGSAPQTLTAADLSASGSPNGVVFTVTSAHKYAETGSYAITLTATDAGGSTTIAHGTATIADAPLTASVTQPTVTTTEGQPFTGAVASFTDANPTATVGDFNYVLINWGDGSPSTVGTVSQPGGVGTAFIVSGTHTYANTGTSIPGPGTFPISVQVHDVDGATLTISNSATVDVVSTTITGTLNPASDTGLSNGVANATSVVTPNFYGSVSPAVPNELITLTATDVGNGTSTVIGRATTNASGDWSITSVTLPQGTYNITAVATDPTGNVTSGATPVTITSHLIIDTTGPKVENVVFNRATGTIFVTYADNTLPDGTPGSGVSLASITDAANYSFTRPHTPYGKFLITGITPIATGVAGQSEVALTINNGHVIKGGFNFNFTIFSESSVKPSGVQDIAENALDGEFYGTFPSGNGINGGDFNARLVAFHNQVLPPITRVGTAAPSGTGTATGAHKPVKKVATATAHHDVAISHVSVKHIARHK